jgi:hypothetical protein
MCGVIDHDRRVPLVRRLGTLLLMSRRTCILTLGAAALALLALVLILNSRSTSNPPTAPLAPNAPAAHATRPITAKTGCRSYPRPGTTIPASSPAGLSAEYGVLAHPQRARDRLGPRWLRSLPVSAIDMAGVRFLARGRYGRVYVIPAGHLLAFPLIPARCVSPAKRQLQRSLTQQLQRRYRHRALCVVIVSALQESPFCDGAPGTVDPLQTAAGAPGFGMVPDGVASVRILFIHRAARRIAVRRNLWIIDRPGAVSPPCGVQWLDRSGIVLRTIQSCRPDKT